MADQTIIFLPLKIQDTVCFLCLLFRRLFAIFRDLDGDHVDAVDDVDPISGRYHTCVYLKQTMSFISPPLSESLVFLEGFSMIF